MALTRATKERRIASLAAEVNAAVETAARHRERAEASEERARRLERELAWLREAPVADPEPEGDR